MKNKLSFFMTILAFIIPMCNISADSGGAIAAGIGGFALGNIFNAAAHHRQPQTVIVERPTYQTDHSAHYYDDLEEKNQALQEEIENLQAKNETLEAQMISKQREELSEQKEEIEMLRAQLQEEQQANDKSIRHDNSEESNPDPA